MSFKGHIPWFNMKMSFLRPSLSLHENVSLKILFLNLTWKCLGSNNYDDWKLREGAISNLIEHPIQVNLL